MGIVYRARQIGLNRIVALKMLPFGQFTRDSFVKRFRAEAESAAKLRHPNIVAIHEVGEQDGQPFFSMDFIEGTTLADLARDQPLPVARAVRFVRTIAEAVHYAHSRGILHRDLKPSNILIDALDQPHVSDFGLARDLSSASELTLSGQTLGSPNYMPPEQVNGKRPTAAPTGDVYSLGAIFYHLLTGRPPFVGETLTTTLQQVSTVEPVSPRLLNPAVPRDVETICLKCLEKDPNQRYRTAEEVAQELARWQADEPIHARPVTKVERTWRWCRRRPALASAAVIIALLLLGLSVGLTSLTFRTREARTQRVHSLLESARGLRMSVRGGHRDAALVDIREAMRQKPAAAAILELRNEAIACLALLDATPGKTWRTRTDAILFNAAQDAYAQMNQAREIVLRRLDGSVIATLKDTNAPLRSLHGFSPDGRLFASIDETAALCLWDIAAHRLAARVPRVDCAAFSPDNQFLAISCANPKPLLVLVSLSDYTQRAICPLPQALNAISFGSESDWFIGLVKQETRIERRSARSGELLGSWPGPVNPVCIAVSHDGQLVAAGTAQGQLATWFSDSGSPVFLSARHTERMTTLSFSHRGDLLASLSWDGVLRLTDPHSGTELLTIDGGGGQIEFRRDDRQLACTVLDEQISLIKISPSPILEILPSSTKCRGVFSLSYSAGGHYLAVAEVDGVRIWNLETKREAAFIPVANPRTAIFLAEDRSLLTSGETGLFRWPLTTNGTALAIGTAELILSGEFSSAATDEPRRRVAVTDMANNRAFVLDLSQQSSPLLLQPHPRIEFVAMTPDGRIVATGAQHSKDVRIWSADTGQLKTIISTRSGARVEFSSDGRLLAVGAEETILYETTNWKPALYPILNGSTQFSTPVAFNQKEGFFVLATHLRDYQLFDSRTGQRLADLLPPPAVASGMPAFSPDGRFMAAVSWTADLQLWDMRALRQELSGLELDW